MEQATVIPMKQRPEGTTVKGWLRDQIESVKAEIDSGERELAEASQVVDMRDGEYADAKGKAKVFAAEYPDADSTEVDRAESDAYDKLADANRSYDEIKRRVSKLRHQFDFMADKIKWMPEGF